MIINMPISSALLRVMESEYHTVRPIAKTNRGKDGPPRASILRAAKDRNSHAPQYRKPAPLDWALRPRTPGWPIQIK